MAIFQKKQPAHAPVLSKDALLTIKREAWQESEKKLASLIESHAGVLQQKTALAAEHKTLLIADGLNQDDGDQTRNGLDSYESQIAQLTRKIASLEAAIVHQQAIHGGISREVNTLQEELSQQKHREYIAELEIRMKNKKEQLIAHLYAGCGLMAELVKLSDEAYAADEHAVLAGDTSVSNAGRRFVQEALEDLNLRTTPIIMIERAGFVPVRSSLAVAQRAYEVRALIPPK